MRIGYVLVFICAVAACRQRGKTLFEKMEASETGIHFTNMITENKEHNVFTYQYYYNGNGVATGDVNNDGLPDLFFTGNQTPSRLFLNKGGFKFEDITATAGVQGRNAWRTGANMVDINGDGLLDIYVCYSGFGTDEERAEQLFINEGNNKDGIPVFTEQAAAYGLDAPGTYTSQTAFFDFDRDGDLDMFQLNHANEFYSPFFNTRRLRTLRHPYYGNRLYRNDNGHFTDISEQAGIFGGGNNFGLGLSVSDINNDGWPDVLVTNDFHEQDYLYLNNRDGTFKEICQEAFGHMSRNSMGSDIADFNNDLLPDVIVLDMLPETHYRQKILQGADEYDKYNLMVDSGYGHQNNRNVLQLHQGFTTDGRPVFAEVGQLSGISNTDWSWASLFADFDNDGYKDLFVTNGYLRESTNLDFMKYQVAEAMQRAYEKGLDVSTAQGYAANMPLYDLVKKMPSTKLSNYMFRNKGDLSFTNETVAWGLAEEGVSSGAAYVDLDNDGDLDLVVCNNNDPVSIYRNNAAGNNYIKVKLEGEGQNRFGIGAKVIVTTEAGEQVQEMYPVRGYQSSVDYTLNFGLGKQQQVKKLTVYWSVDSATVISVPAVNATVTVKKYDAVKMQDTDAAHTVLFTDISSIAAMGYRHTENQFVDFKREFLMPYQLSRNGPKMSKADVNNDGLEDVFIGGAAKQAGVLYLQLKNGKFIRSASQPWQADAISEDAGSVFFDADNDGDADLYVVSGGNEWIVPGKELQDRLYINDGKGNFRRDENALPREVYNGTCVIPADIDNDGDTDLFIGAGVMPGHYPLSVGNIILRNDLDRTTGQVRFTNITSSAAGDVLLKAGMVTDACWTDIDKDGWTDLVIAGEWMPVMIFRNEKGKQFRDITASSALGNTNGWWQRIITADIDKDGDMDFIVGNMGLNTQFRTSEQEPLTTYLADFNNDGRMDPVMTWYIQHWSYPFNTRDELVEQMPVLNKKYIKYDDYARATIHNMFSEEAIGKARQYHIYHMATAVLVNNGEKFTMRTLPPEAQFSVVNSILYKDYDGDGKEDILLAGNFYPFRVQQGRCDAGLGLLLKGDGKGNFIPVDRNASGLYIPGDVRDMKELKTSAGSMILVSKNNDTLQVLKNNKPVHPS